MRMIPVKVSVRSSISGEAGEEEIRQEVEGRFAEGEAGWVLRYVERPGEADEVRTTLHAREESITVIRSGTLAYRHTYRPGETGTSRVCTPAGTAEMEVKTLDYRRSRWEGGGELRFSFDLRMAGEDMGRYALHIRWKE
jgi:uncharacterized beta-barrel protein YwiB (DUF1934 family)